MTINQSKRQGFSSELGFILVAVSGVVGLGNIWGFPTQVAMNGGSTFIVSYLIISFALGYPLLMTELIIGHSVKANAVTSLEEFNNNFKARRIGVFLGTLSTVIVTFILGFYSIVAGWVLAFLVDSIFRIFGITTYSAWMTGFSEIRNASFCVLFLLVTVFISSKGVREGLEKMAKVLSFFFLIILLGLIIYVATLDGAREGLIAYLTPNISHIFDPKILLNALGQSFFSLSLGSGTLIVYGSYISSNTRLPLSGSIIVASDAFIGFAAGLLIIPAMYVAQANGIQIMSETGVLLKDDTLIFQVLPSLFNSMGIVGLLLSVLIFFLLTFASITSSVAMFEVPLSYFVERQEVDREKAAWRLFLFLSVMALLIAFNFDWLFGLIITITTRYGQPLVCLGIVLFFSWFYKNSSALSQLRKESGDRAGGSLFWSLLPLYVRFVCPILIIVIFIQSLQA